MRSTLIFCSVLVGVWGMAADPVGKVPPVDPGVAVAPIAKKEIVVPIMPLPTEIVSPAPKIWAGTVEAGLNGAAGNSEQFSSRFGFAAKRTGADADLVVNAKYLNASADGRETQNQFLSDARQEWKFGPSPWTAFVFGNLTYDEFQNWDLRFLTGGGLGYKWIKTDTTTFITRFGAGVAREVGGIRNEFIPEANLALEFERKLTQRQSLVGLVEYFPSFLSIDDYRINAKASWDMLIDPEWNLNIRVGVQDRYQSQPLGREPNDINYFTEIVWKY